jgi:hypothetical protein
MRQLMVLLMASCGYAPLAPVGGVDAPGIDAGDGVDVGPTCWSLSDATDGTHWSGCTSAAAGGAIDVTADTVINTDNKASSPAGYTCVVVSIAVNSDHTDICALFASSIKVEAGVTLSATGQRPLALFAHSIDIEGTVDVASHITGPRAGQRGAASNVTGCNPGGSSTKGGGGAGGTWGFTGGKGGDQGGVTGTGNAVGHTIPTPLLRGGCDGRRGGDTSASGGPDGSGGAGGGAVWIASDMGMLTLGSSAIINASGQSGQGATADGHGGFGGGSGGLIVLQSTAITRDVINSQIFANGGSGGGGAGNGVTGMNGGDSTSPASLGPGGVGGDMGNGGNGFPAISTLAGSNGGTSNMSGGGGGGGGAGVIRFATNTAFSDPDDHVSPDPVISPP